MKTILVTGAAGFIGYHTAAHLLGQGCQVIGIDNLNCYYDVKLKEYRLEKLKQHHNFTFYHSDIEHYDDLNEIFQNHMIKGVINLAAMAGVRYSIFNPVIYIRTNIIGVINLLELCRKYHIHKFVLASSSSLYAGQQLPFTEDLPVNKPISPYAASKKGAENICYTYHHLYGTDITVLRYFTVYGPAGRPDMSPFRFIKLISEGSPIELYGDGTQKRDFTYVGDIAAGTVKALETKTEFAIVNLGNSKPQELNYLIHLIEQNVGTHATIIQKPFHKADMMATWANTERATELLGWNPQVTLEEGIRKTVTWHREFKGLLEMLTI